MLLLGELPTLTAHMAEPAFGAVFAVPAVPIVFNADYPTVHISILAILLWCVCAKFVLNRVYLLCLYEIQLWEPEGQEKDFVGGEDCCNHREIIITARTL